MLSPLRKVKQDKNATKTQNTKQHKKLNIMLITLVHFSVLVLLWQKMTF
jgi:hypothetical protein